MNWISVKYRTPTMEECVYRNGYLKPIIICRRIKTHSEVGFFNGKNFTLTPIKSDDIPINDVEFWAPFPKCPAEHPPIPWEAD